MLASSTLMQFRTTINNAYLNNINWFPWRIVCCFIFWDSLKWYRIVIPAHAVSEASVFVSSNYAVETGFLLLCVSCWGHLCLVCCANWKPMECGSASATSRRSSVDVLVMCTPHGSILHLERFCRDDGKPLWAPMRTIMVCWHRAVTICGVNKCNCIMDRALGYCRVEHTWVGLRGRDCWPD
jgi:hypothetical protein